MISYKISIYNMKATCAAAAQGDAGEHESAAQD
jgi:hypothetical protein